MLEVAGVDELADAHERADELLQRPVQLDHAHRIAVLVDAHLVHLADRVGEREPVGEVVEVHGVGVAPVVLDLARVVHVPRALLLCGAAPAAVLVILARQTERPGQQADAHESGVRQTALDERVGEVDALQRLGEVVDVEVALVPLVLAEAAGRCSPQTAESVLHLRSTHRQGGERVHALQAEHVRRGVARVVEEHERELQHQGARVVHAEVRVGGERVDQALHEEQARHGGLERANVRDRVDAELVELGVVVANVRRVALEPVEQLLRRKAHRARLVRRIAHHRVEVALRHLLLAHAVARILPAATQAREVRRELLELARVAELRVDDELLVDHALERLVLAEGGRDGVLLLHECLAVGGGVRTLQLGGEGLAERAAALSGEEVLRALEAVLDERLDGLRREQPRVEHAVGGADVGENAQQGAGLSAMRHEPHAARPHLLQGHRHGVGDAVLLPVRGAALHALAHAARRRVVARPLATADPAAEHVCQDCSDATELLRGDTARPARVQAEYHLLRLRVEEAGHLQVVEADGEVGVDVAEIAERVHKPVCRVLEQLLRRETIAGAEGCHDEVVEPLRLLAVGVPQLPGGSVPRALRESEDVVEPHLVLGSEVNRQATVLHHRADAVLDGVLGLGEGEVTHLGGLVLRSGRPAEPAPHPAVHAERVILREPHVEDDGVAEGGPLAALLRRPLARVHLALELDPGIAVDAESETLAGGELAGESAGRDGAEGLVVQQTKHVAPGLNVDDALALEERLGLAEALGAAHLRAEALRHEERLLLARRLAGADVALPALLLQRTVVPAGVEARELQVAAKSLLALLVEDGEDAVLADVVALAGRLAGSVVQALVDLSVEPDAQRAADGGRVEDEGEELRRSERLRVRPDARRVQARGTHDVHHLCALPLQERQGGECHLVLGGLCSTRLL